MTDDIEYPTRCQVIDVDVLGYEVADGLMAATPPASRPHVGKRGTAEFLADGNVRLTLDDGTILYGYECWWVPLPAPPQEPQP